MTSPLLTLQGRLRRLGVDALLFNTSETLFSPNVRHFSGFTGSDASMLVTRTVRHFFTDGRYKSQARQEVAGFEIHIVKSKLDALAGTLRREGVRRLGIESPRISNEFAMTLARKAQNVKMIPLSRKFFDGLRLLKSPEDKKKIEKAAEIASRSCEEVLGSGLLGRTEMDVAAELEHRFRQNGAHGIAFDTIVASGVRSALPHGKATEKVIQSGELVVIDFGCRFDGYHSDETVTCSVGPASPEQQKVHQAVYQAHMKAIDSIKVGARLCVLDRVAREIIGRAGYGKYFVHRLGHGVGLEVHEPPYLSSQASGVVAEGMVFTIEPGVYLERVGGVRLESLIFVDSAGPAILSSMSKNLITVHPHR